MRKLVIPVAVLVILVVAAVIGWRVYSGPPAPPAKVAVGGTVQDFTLPDISGQAHTLSSLAGDKGVLLIFIATACPYSNGYNARMEALWRDYQGRGIRVVGINPNRTEPVDEIRSHAEKNGFTFTILRDEGNRIADYFGASVTPEAFLIDPGLRLRYHGRLDAAHDDPGLNCGEVRQVMDQHLEGQEVVVEGKKAFGCTIKRVSG